MSGRKPRKNMAAPDWEAAFLSALRITGRVTRACAAANVSRSAAYVHRSQDEEFARQWDQALLESSPVLEEEARRRALEGTRKYKFFQGEPLLIACEEDDPEGFRNASGRWVKHYYEHELSDTCLIFLLKANNAPKFGDRIHVRQTKETVPQGRDGIYDLLKDRIGSAN